MSETLATKDDLTTLRTEVKSDIAALRVEVKDDIATLRTEVKGDIAALRVEVRDDSAALRDDIKILHDRLNSQNIVILTGFVVTIASVVITRLLS